MSVEVLVAARNQTDHQLVQKLNIQSDVIIGNQCDRNEIEIYRYKEFQVTYLNHAERGLGRNRNQTLMRSQGDYCLLCDDDMVYVDGYPGIVEEQFRKYPHADVIIFNLIEAVPRRYVIKKPMKINYFNFMRFGSVRIAMKRKSILNHGIFFNITVGSGTKHGFGEDTLFLADCLKKGLKLCAVPVPIARLTEERESTWFHGYTRKYFEDKGVLFYFLSKKWYRFLCFQDAVRHKSLYQKPWKESYGLMLSGIRKEI